MENSKSSSLKFLILKIDLDLFVIEFGESRSDSVRLSHLEILSEVLIAGQPVGPDHIDTLFEASLMEVELADVVLLSVDGESAVSVRGAVLIAKLPESAPPVH